MRNSIADTVPAIYDADNRTIHFGYVERAQQEGDGEPQVRYHGYALPLTGHMEYGHVKSQIVRYAYPDKDVDALVNNALSALLRERAGSVLAPEDETDIARFLDFDEWRVIAGIAARTLMSWARGDER